MRDEVYDLKQELDRRRFYLGMQYDHTLILTTKRPLRHQIDGTNIMALYMEAGDCGRQEVCRAYAEQFWPGCTDHLRPCDYIEVFQPIGSVGEFYKYEGQS